MRRFRVHAITLLCLVRAAVPAAAQDEPDTTEVVPLAPVVVTVLSTPAELARAPFAVSTVDAVRSARARPGLGLDETLRGVPGVQVDNRYNYALGERISIRGFGARAQFGVRGVRVIVDGVPATFPDGQSALGHVDPRFVERAEVIRGPASALYGNASGGVIQLQMPPPGRVRRPETTAIAGSGGFVRVDGRAAARAAGLSWGLDVSRVELDGYREFSAARSLRAGARATRASGPSTLLLTATALDYDAENPGSLSRELVAIDRTQAFARNLEQKTGERGRQLQLGGVWTREVGGGDWEFATYGIARVIENPIPTTIIDLDRRVGGVRTLFRSRPGDRLPWLRYSVGAELAWQRDDRLNRENLQGERGEPTLDQRETVTTGALVAQLSATPHPRIGILAALRYDAFRFRAHDHLIAADDPDDSGSRAMDAASPSAGVRYTPGAGTNVYANVATSFETPTTTELANRPDGAGGFNPTLEPQRARSLEVGAKGLLRGRIVYEVAAYRVGIRNALIPFQVPDVPGRDFFRNAGSAVHRGVEAAIGPLAAGPLRVHATYTYTDARFARYRIGEDVYDGSRVPGIAPHRATLALSLEPNAWYAGLDVRTASRTPVDDANLEYSAAHSVIDARLGLRPLAAGRLTVEPFLSVTNVLASDYDASVVVNAFGGRYFEPGPGRQTFVGLRGALR